MPPPVAPLPLTLVTLVLAAGAVAAAPPAAALCAAEEPEAVVARLLEDEVPLVLATVTAQARPEADLLVEEVWSGPDRPQRLTVGTGQWDPGVFSEGDQDLAVGRRYLLTLDDRDQPPRIGYCATVLLDGVPEDAGLLAAVRPDDARPPVVPRATVQDAAHRGPGDGDVASVPRGVGAGAAAAVVVGGGALLVARRRGARRG